MVVYNAKIKILFFINKISTVKKKYIRFQSCNSHYPVSLLFERKPVFAIHTFPEQKFMGK